MPASKTEWYTISGILAALILYLWWEGLLPSGVMGAVASVTHAVGVTKRQRAQQLAPYVEHHRGAVPWGVAMAIAEHESGFDPAATNASGACGVWQIMRQYFGSYSVSEQTAYLHAASADLATVLDRSTAGALAAANRAHADVLRFAPELDPARGGVTEAYAFAIYYSHAEGRGNLQKALAYAVSVGGVTVDAMAAARTPYNRIGGFRQVAQLAPWWEERRGEYLA